MVEKLGNMITGELRTQVGEQKKAALPRFWCK